MADQIHHAFLFTVDHAAEFFQLCQEREAVTREDREKLLFEFIAQKKAEYIGSTFKSAPELATELIKEGYNAVSYVKPERKCPPMK